MKNLDPDAQALIAVGILFFLVMFGSAAIIYATNSGTCKECQECKTQLNLKHIFIIL